MRNATVLFVLTFIGSALHAQECTERFSPFDMTTSDQNQTLRPGDQVWVEFSTDCFHIPQSFWFDELTQWRNQEDYSSDELAASGSWFDISRYPADSVPGAVLGNDGKKLEFQTSLVELENGRMRSVATIPSLIGKQTLGGLGPVAVGDELIANWYLDLSMPLGDFLSATLPGHRRNLISFTVAVPEPSNSGAAWLVVVALMLHQMRRRPTRKLPSR